MRWHSRRARALAFQLGLVLLLCFFLGWLLANTLTNMRARGIQSGFDFLASTSGFDIGESLIEFDSGQPYWRAFLVGMLNTLRVSVTGIVLCTLIGTLVGIGRVGSNALARGLCYAYTEVLRNVPILLQLLMWYVLLLEWMPDADAPLEWLHAVYLSKGGLSLPTLVWESSGNFPALLWELPRLIEGEVRGGMNLSPEFLAVTLGLSLYTSAFVAEVVRSGLQSVPRGQVEAARSLGLSQGLTLRRVVLPQAMRVIVPPMTNQYLNLTKNSSLAVAIGYPDLVNISNTALNQTGRAVECIALIMGIYLTLSLITSALMNAYNRRVAIRER
jgi:general L-amino acid transport system permease protein